MKCRAGSVVGQERACEVLSWECGGAGKGVRSVELGVWWGRPKEVCVLGLTAASICRAVAALHSCSQTRAHRVLFGMHSVQRRMHGAQHRARAHTNPAHAVQHNAHRARSPMLALAFAPWDPQ